MLLLCYDNNISLKNLDDNTFPSIKGGKIPLENVVDNAYYSKYRMRLREKNILFLDQIISGNTSRLLLWKEILIKAYIPVFSQRKETKWYSDIRNLITSDGVHLNYYITQLFGARVDNVEEARSYNITKKNRSLIAVYNSQFNSVVIGKIQGIDETQRPIIKHFHIDMSRCTDTHTYIYQLPLLTDSQFAPSQLTNLIEFNIFNIFDFAKKKYDIIHQALTQNHVISPQLQDNIILDLLDSSTSRNDLLAIQRTLAPFDNNNYYIFEFYTDGSLIELGTEQSLSVVPKNSKVRINTDSLNVITQFEKLKKSRFSQTSREYFKANNNFLWAILCRIILTLNLHVEMFKVVAHGDDIEYNDNIQDFNALMALDIWDISYDPNVFTFIDLIKGIIPMSLSELLSSWTTKKTCSHLKEFERSMGLTKKKKLEFKSVRSLLNNNSSNNNIIHYDSLDSIRNYIYFGSILLSSAGRALTYQVSASVWEVVG
ncbi:unnamed protein product [Rhizophagus irregularis]|nr:unnamed protein product [Rhizophagus irregularis]